MSRCRKNNIDIVKPGLTAYSDNISSLTETLKLFITDDILNEICHHTNAGGSSRFPKMCKGIHSEELFAFLGLCIVSGVLRTRKEPAAKMWTTNTAYARPKALAFENIPQLDGVACVNAFVLWMLKYHYWQLKKNRRRHLYLLSVGEEMVTPHIRKRADSGCVDRHTCRVMRANSVAYKQQASPTAVKKGAGRRRGRCSVCPAAKDRKIDWKCCEGSGWVCKNRCIKTIQITCDNCKEQSF